MSTLKHKSFRKVLNVENFNTKFGDTLVPSKRVLWCTVDSETSRTVRTTHIGLTTYVGGVKFSGIDARHPKKPVSISLKSPLDSKCLSEMRMNSMYRTSHGDACRAYSMHPSRSKGLVGVVSWFDNLSGDGMIRHNGEVYSVYACNIQGAKTGYPETACINLVKGQEVTFDLYDFGTHLSAVNVSNGILDIEKWAALDQSKLAFKKDENGNYINGLFE